MILFACSVFSQDIMWSRKQNVFLIANKECAVSIGVASGDFWWRFAIPPHDAAFSNGVMWTDRVIRVNCRTNKVPITIGFRENNTFTWKESPGFALDWGSSESLRCDFQKEFYLYPEKNTNHLFVTEVLIFVRPDHTFFCESHIKRGDFSYRHK